MQKPTSMNRVFRWLVHKRKVAIPFRTFRLLVESLMHVSCALVDAGAELHICEKRRTPMEISRWMIYWGCVWNGVEERQGWRSVKINIVCNLLGFRHVVWYQHRRTISRWSSRREKRDTLQGDMRGANSTCGETRSDVHLIHVLIFVNIAAWFASRNQQQ